MKSLFSGSFLWTRATIIYGICIFFKFIAFDMIWCSQTTFSAFSTVELYLNGILATLFCLLPYGCFKKNVLQISVMFLLDALLMVNLMYCRTYNTFIPLESYGLASNLADFTSSVYDSFHGVDIVLPLSTVLCIILLKVREKKESLRTMHVAYLVPLLLAFLLSTGVILIKGGFKKAYSSLQSANYYTCGTPMYTVFGSLLYDALQQQVVCTPQIEQEILQWQHRHPAYKPLPDSIPQRTNLVVILCESLESWVLERKMEGKEITPYLNKLLQEPSTLYAPQVLTQVKGGRSIDGQPLLNAGMLPIENGTYSMVYPDNTYCTLTKALKGKYGARGYLLTVDKKITWNQSVVAERFGIDTLLSKPCFKLDERVGSRKKLGDVSFFRQCVEKLKKGEVWKEGKKAYFQCVTYSGHNPFKLPEKLHRISFSGTYPQKMKDYMIIANYTDYAISQFIEYLKTRSDYANTMIVITGDHEGLAADRAPLCASKEGRGIVSDKPFTPFIVVNSPVAMRYEPVMGQVDMYSTILNLMHLDDYEWKGEGQSILDPDKAPFAVGSQMNIEGDTMMVARQEIRRQEQAYAISDWMIKYNVLKSPIENVNIRVAHREYSH
ncbi:MAG: LTA synthase family protein [Bacteroides sp.]|nr:LTA synthase family protein [Bacteroides sp.]